MLELFESQVELGNRMFIMQFKCDGWRLCSLIRFMDDEDMGMVVKMNGIFSVDTIYFTGQTVSSQCSRPHGGTSSVQF